MMMMMMMMMMLILILSSSCKELRKFSEIPAVPLRWDGSRKSFYVYRGGMTR